MVNVLLVDDDPDSLLPLALALVPAGCTVTLATSAAADLTVIRRHAVQCLVTDLEMPQVNGVRLCQMIRSQPAFADLLCWYRPRPNRSSESGAGQQLSENLSRSLIYWTWSTGTRQRDWPTPKQAKMSRQASRSAFTLAARQMVMAARIKAGN